VLPNAFSPAYSTVLAALLLAACASEPPEASPYTFDVPSEGGIGKLFHGREIARFEGHAAHFDRPDRAPTEMPERVLDVMALRPDAVVADVGAGTGFFTVRLARRVPEGQVLAVDIDEQMLARVRRRADSLGLGNVRAVRGGEQSPGLDAASVDAVLIVDSYHEFTYPAEMLARLHSALRPGGRLFLVEYRGEDDTLPVGPLHRMTVEQARREVESAGFAFRTNHAVLPQQHLLVFERAAR
jgi:ubiquinone/menaquinone biosynthesis C-methylase UbiE